MVSRRTLPGMSQMSSGSSRNCVACGRPIAWDANVCPYCGHDFRVQMAGPMPRNEVSTGVKILVYLLSFFIPIVGFIIGVIFYTRPEPEQKHVGKMCFILALLPIILGLLCWAIVALAGLALLPW